jgi:uncharacterized protein (DUF305 family)
VKETQMHPDRFRTRSAGLALVATLGVGLLAGCSGDDGTPVPGATSPTAPVLQPGKPGEPNASLTGTDAIATRTGSPDRADTQFMQDMIVHHAQAIVMVDLVVDRLTDPKVKGLAERMRDEQRPEIDGMARWLKDKGQSVPVQATNVQAPGSGHHSSMPGMATPAQLEELKQATGVQADRLFLQRMITHHEGALTMAATQQRDGKDEYVGDLSTEVYATQSVQIGAMKEMLARLS